MVLVEGEGKRQQNTSLRLGLEALFMGCDMDTQGFDRFVTSVGQDQGIAGAVQEVFLLALDGAGVALKTYTEHNKRMRPACFC